MMGRTVSMERVFDKFFEYNMEMLLGDSNAKIGGE
jgi:hypothetical protein